MMNQIVEAKILPHLDYLINEVLKYKSELNMDGIDVFQKGDRFVAGKIINGACFLLIMTEDEEKRQLLIEQIKELIRFTAPLYMETWGYLNYIQGLYRLKEHDLLECVLDEDVTKILKESLDWRKFVDTKDLSLIDKPTNYYGVAFAVARYRELLGWDDSNISQLLFDKLVDHIIAYSGEYLFMDETAGEGRFDRYSILIPGEVCSTLYGTNMEIPEVLLKMLRQSASICLQLSNESGHGIAYGRSIGAYGDTAVLEVLSIAAVLGVLDEDEIIMAHGYNDAIMKQFVDFWIDGEMKSVNLWNKGRATDAYRHKGRILGENFSLCCQVLHTYHQWESLNVKDIESPKDWKALIKRLPKSQYYRFAKNEYERGLLVVRDGRHTFELPMINGGGGTAGDVHGLSYYYGTPYLPTPQEPQVLEVQPDSHYPHLVPRFSLKDGTELMAVSYINEIKVGMDQKDNTQVVMNHNEMCKVGKRYPEKDGRAMCQIKYRFEEGMIERTDSYTFNPDLLLEDIVMEFHTFSETLQVKNCGEIEFEKGPIKKITVTGLEFDTWQSFDENPESYTSHGSLKTKLLFKSKMNEKESQFKCQWKIWYR